MSTPAKVRVETDASRAQRVDLRLDVIGVVAQVLPRLSVRVFAEGMIDGSDICSRVFTCDAAAKDVELVATCSLNCWIPVELLPRVVWVGIGVSDRGTGSHSAR